jgi:AAA domain/DnaB-like helicase N terminal domain
MSTEAQPLPYSESGEKGVLCSLFLAPAEAGDACSRRLLKPEHFFDPAHKTIYETLLEWSGAGEVEFAWLKAEIEKRGQLEHVGGPEFLNELTRFVPTGSNAGYYIDLVRDAWRDREGVLLGMKLAEGAGFKEVFEKLQAVDSDYQGSSSYPPIESVDSLLEENIDEPREIVAGLAHQGSKVAVGGGSKSYKTWLLTDLAVSVAAGSAWVGRRTAPGKVLYVNLEIERSFYQKRVRAIAEAKGLSLSEAWRKNLDVWNLRGYCMDAESLCKNLCRLKGKGYALIVVDPLYKIVGNREENSNDQITSLLNLLEKVARETGAAVAYGNHFSKGNQAAKESIDRISGAGAFARDPDTIITLTKHETDDAYAVECTLRNFPPVAPFCLRWEYPLFVPDDSLDPGRLKKPAGGRKPTYSMDDLVGCLRGRELTTEEFKKAVIDKTGMSARTFHKLLREAEESGLLHKCKIDSKWEVVTATAIS